jgi:hypothetical protein
MNIKSRITRTVKEALSLRIRRNDSLWPGVFSLCETYGEDRVIRALEEWIRVKTELFSFTPFPLDAFIDFAREFLNREDTLKASPESH